MDASKRGGTNASVAAAEGLDRGSVRGAWEVSKRMRERLREDREDTGAKSVAADMVRA